MAGGRADILKNERHGSARGKEEVSALVYSDGLEYTNTGGIKSNERF